ncbi:MAG: peptidase C45 [Actinomycetota bacterium]|nr:MAG: peptidase C45 [Actinomycetota bacterium]
MPTVTPPEIPLLRVGGSHREAGRQVGAACAETIRSAFDEAKIPCGRTREEQLALADRYREVTAAAYPWYLEELEGIAEGAGADPRELFACMIEEIWYEPYASRVQGRCTDLVAVPPATAEGKVLVAHNNDMPRSYQEQLVAIEWGIEGEPVVLTIGNGLWISVGWSSVGLSFTGNELAPLDERIGIPREIQFRSMLRQPTFEDALREALRPDRASSYNHVIVARDGRVANVEGSATDAEILRPDERGTLAHTNHYVCERMRRYEGDPSYVPHSSARYRRARELLAAAAPGSITAERLREMLADHEGAPDCLCRHPERWGETPMGSATAFWCVADVTEMVVTFGRGNPCDSIAQTYAFG